MESRSWKRSMMNRSAEREQVQLRVSDYMKEGGKKRRTAKDEATATITPAQLQMEFPWRKRWMMNRWTGRQRVLDDDGLEGGRGRERVHEGRKRGRKEESRATKRWSCTTITHRIGCRWKARHVNRLMMDRWWWWEMGGGRGEGSLFLFSLCQFVFRFVPLSTCHVNLCWHQEDHAFLSSLLFLHAGFSRSIWSEWSSLSRRGCVGFDEERLRSVLVHGLLSIRENRRKVHEDRQGRPSILPFVFSLAFSFSSVLLALFPPLFPLWIKWDIWRRRWGASLRSLSLLSSSSLIRSTDWICQNSWDSNDFFERFQWTDTAECRRLWFRFRSSVVGTTMCGWQDLKTFRCFKNCASRLVFLWMFPVGRQAKCLGILPPPLLLSDYPCSGNHEVRVARSEDILASLPWRDFQDRATPLVLQYRISSFLSVLSPSSPLRHFPRARDPLSRFSSFLVSITRAMLRIIAIPVLLPPLLCPWLCLFAFLLFLMPFPHLFAFSFSKGDIQNYCHANVLLTRISSVVSSSSFSFSLLIAVPFPLLFSLFPLIVSRLSSFLVQKGDIQNYCHPNALLTLQEYVEDYATPSTQQQVWEKSLDVSGSWANTLFTHLAKTTRSEEKLVDQCPLSLSLCFDCSVHLSPSSLFRVCFLFCSLVFLFSVSLYLFLCLFAHLLCLFSLCRRRSWSRSRRISSPRPTDASSSSRNWRRSKTTEKETSISNLNNKLQSRPQHWRLITAWSPCPREWLWWPLLFLRSALVLH